MDCYDPEPDLTCKTTWKEFLKSHWNVLAACDLFSIELFVKGKLVRYMVFFALHVATRKVEILGVDTQPNGPWMEQIARNISGEGGFLTGKKYLRDHETRTIPIPRETVQLLANLQAESDEGDPYVFLTVDRLNHVVGRRAEGTWQSDFELVNNLTRDLEVMCRHAEVEYFTPHDLRRSCITNWARRLPIQTVPHLAGHSSIATTRKYYLAVLEADCTAAREIQSELMTSLTNF